MAGKESQFTRLDLPVPFAGPGAQAGQWWTGFIDKLPFHRGNEGIQKIRFVDRVASVSRMDEPVRATGGQERHAGPLQEGQQSPPGGARSGDSRLHGGMIPPEDLFFFHPWVFRQKKGVTIKVAGEVGQTVIFEPHQEFRQQDGKINQIKQGMGDQEMTPTQPIGSVGTRLGTGNDNNQ